MVRFVFTTETATIFVTFGIKPLLTCGLRIFSACKALGIEFMSAAGCKKSPVSEETGQEAVTLKAGRTSAENGQLQKNNFPAKADVRLLTSAPVHGEWGRGSTHLKGYGLGEML